MCKARSEGSGGQKLVCTDTCGYATLELGWKRTGEGGSPGVEADPVLGRGGRHDLREEAVSAEGDLIPANRGHRRLRHPTILLRRLQPAVQSQAALPTHAPQSLLTTSPHTSNHRPLLALHQHTHPTPHSPTQETQLQTNIYLNSPYHVTDYLYSSTWREMRLAERSHDASEDRADDQQVGQ